MQHLLILIGISGSGKSTFARQFVQENPSYLRINRDELRRSILPVALADYWRWDDQRKQPVERLVTELEKTALQAALTGGFNVLLDNTHLRPRYLNELLDRIRAYARPEKPVEVTFRLIALSPEEAIERDRLRPDSVGEAVIREQYGRLQQLQSQFDLSQRWRFPEPAVSSTGDPLPRCVLVDIDGTVAKIHNRTPYEWLKVDRDKPNGPVIEVVKALRQAGYAVVFLSGRDSAARTLTVAWLQRHFGWREGPDYTLFMRAKNDMRKDALVKRELFDAHIRDRYRVALVLDDRDQVVALWRKELGLTCLQVDYGNF